jgi:hypothetical protein|tara:strand:- start:5353 stop:5955 length:603 start_codon:yes stop_codon:yes gene_type:complete
MTVAELRIIVVVYLSVIVPIIVLLTLKRRNQLPTSILKIYIYSFLICALGWELWFTYGWVSGDPVDMRRSEILNYFIPKNINWLMNALGDAGTVCLGGLLITSKVLTKQHLFLEGWNWKVFLVLLIWCIGQNILVEMFLYYDQLAAGKSLSWAPLAPTGPWLNPVLFDFNDRTISLQSQIPWLLMAPILYKLSIYLHRKP